MTKKVTLLRLKILLSFCLKKCPFSRFPKGILKISIGCSGMVFNNSQDYPGNPRIFSARVRTDRFNFFTIFLLLSQFCLQNMIKLIMRYVEKGVFKIGKTTYRSNLELNFLTLHSYSKTLDLLVISLFGTENTLFYLFSF